MPIPDELVTTSASGLDPRPVARGGALAGARASPRARGVAEDRVRAVIESRVEGRDLGFLGEPRVNVLLLNLALDQQFGTAPPPPATAVAGTR